MFWVSAFKLFFHIRVGGRPELVEVCGDLDGASIGGEDFEAQWDSAVGQLQVGGV